MAEIGGVDSPSLIALMQSPNAVKDDCEGEDGYIFASISCSGPTKFSPFFFVAGDS